MVWIDRDHPWASKERWILPRNTWKTLTAAGASLLHLRYSRDDNTCTDLFHEEHEPADGRWSHAKVYSFRRRTSCRLLVTSANFSPAAWGVESRNGDLTIENFELGVCVEQATWQRLEDLEVFDDERTAATVSKLPSPSVALITWARAVWNGKTVNINCRCVANRELAGQLNSGDKPTPITHWTIGADKRLRSARVPRVDAKRPPLFVRLTCEHETVSVPVFDERPFRETEDTLPPEVDEKVAQETRDGLLFEQYGGRVASDPEGEGPIDEGKKPPGREEELEKGSAGPSDSYDVPAFELARRHLGVVVKWAEQVNRLGGPGTGAFERQVLRRDGEMLARAFQRQAERDAKKGPANGIGARLAAEELTLRLRHFPEA